MPDKISYLALELIRRELDFALESPWNFELGESMPNEFSEIISTVEIHSWSLQSFASMCKMTYSKPRCHVKAVTIVQRNANEFPFHYLLDQVNTYMATSKNSPNIKFNIYLSNNID